MPSGEPSWHAALLALAPAGAAVIQTPASCSCSFPNFTLQALKDVGALACMVAEGASLAEREAASEAEQRRAAAQQAQAASDRAAASEQALAASKARAAKLQQELQGKQQVRFAFECCCRSHTRVISVWEKKNRRRQKASEAPLKTMAAAAGLHAPPPKA